ncbi:alpha/beta fold hydrolase [Chitinophaga cymbidii]|uniref:AB hydrolase-1 domain-containing protein n=1 Tax=Chitinophaga cymbidii TaxID=1096750 RepID=A0A512RS30_9BACT|nr:alpha/beta hydrolase [Chitinophaga cymbidii]GEP98496.1 hypothetical protein CCY01nite_47560 [Chitinophaga cymbidii]
MKRLLYLEVIISFIMTFPQQAKSQDGPPPTFFQVVDVSGYKGASFTMECWLYADEIPPTYGAIMMAIGMENGKVVSNKVGKFSAADFKPGQWNKIELSGKLDKQAGSLAIGVLYGSGPDRYYFDDIKLWVKKNDTLLKDGNFEAAGVDAWKFSNTRKQVNVVKSTDKARSGKQSLLIDASGTSAEKYGHDDQHGHYADINGHRIYYEVYGEGKPLLLLHGSMESIASFDHQIPAFARTFKVIAMDTRGHGRSSRDTGAVGYELFAGDVFELLNTLQLDSVNILGWSDGGITGLLLAMQHPEKVAKLAVMGANLYNNESSVYDWVNDAVRDQIKQLKKKDDPSSAFAIKMKYLVLQQPNISPASLQNIKCPVLVMAGGKDVIKPAHTKLIADSIPAATLKIFEHASHYAPAEIPQEFNRAVIDFFKR